MNKPKKRTIDWGKDNGWSKTEQVGYNQACDDWEAWLPTEYIRRTAVCSRCQRIDELNQ